MTTAVEVSGPVPEQESNPPLGENEPPHDGLCANVRCRKGPIGTRGVLKSRKAKYCCAYCRVDVCRRTRPKPERLEKPMRKRRSDAQYRPHAERQRAYDQARSWARAFRRSHFFKSDWDALKSGQTEK
jgi:hypothetical protein